MSVVLRPGDEGRFEERLECRKRAGGEFEPVVPNAGETLGAAAQRLAQEGAFAFRWMRVPVAELFGPGRRGPDHERR